MTASRLLAAGLAALALAGADARFGRSLFAAPPLPAGFPTVTSITLNSDVDASDTYVLASLQLSDGEEYTLFGSGTLSSTAYLQNATSAGGTALYSAGGSCATVITNATSALQADCPTTGEDGLITADFSASAGSAFAQTQVQIQGSSPTPPSAPPAPPSSRPADLCKAALALVEGFLCSEEAAGQDYSYAFPALQAALAGKAGSLGDLSPTADALFGELSKLCLAVDAATPESGHGGYGYGGGQGSYGSRQSGYTCSAQAL